MAESSAKKALAAEIIAQKCTTQLATNAVSGAKCLFGRQAKGLFIVAIALKKNAVIPCPRETKGEILVTETVADFILKRGGCIRQYVIIAARSAKCRLCQAKAGKRIVKNVLIVARQQVDLRTNASNGAKHADAYKEHFEALNAKLNEILSLLAPKSAGKPPKKKPAKKAVASKGAKKK